MSVTAILRSLPSLIALKMASTKMYPFNCANYLDILNNFETSAVGIHLQIMWVTIGMCRSHGLLVMCDDWLKDVTPHLIHRQLRHAHSRSPALTVRCTYFHCVMTDAADFLCLWSKLHLIRCNIYKSVIFFSAIFFSPM